jgi:hypothetical protein
MPGCQRIAAPLPQPTVRPGGGVDFMINVIQVVPGGLGLVQRHETALNKDTLRFLQKSGRSRPP